MILPSAVLSWILAGRLALQSTMAFLLQVIWEKISLTYPTVDSIASLIWSFGTGCLLYKHDLKRAYRQFPVDPLDYPLLGYCWQHSLHFDSVLLMGLRSDAMACQRIMNAVCYICEMEGHHTLSY